MKIIRLFFLVILCNYSLLADTKAIYSFSNVGINFFDWTDKTENVTTKKDFSYLSVEGGIAWDFAEIYATANLENPLKSYSDEAPNNLRYTALIDTDVNIVNQFRLHIQNFYLEGNDFYVNDFVLGFGYKYINQNFWIRPFIGAHHTDDSFYSGWNGYMTGWTLNYIFKVYGENFSLFQWNEIEFGRSRKFYLNGNVPIGDGKSYGLNGSVNFFWNINKKITTGVQYRYADHKLGSIEYQAGVIYMLKYNF